MIRVALLGAGSIGALHAANLAAHPEFALTRVADTDLARAEALAARFGGGAHDEAEAAVAAPDVDAVIVGSSTDAHRDHVLLAARRKRALLCEKPVATSLEDAVACVAAVEAAGIVASMGFNRRLDAAYAALRNGVARGEIGAVETLRLVSRSDAPPPPESAARSGGMIREKGAHFYDLAAWIAGADPVEAVALGGCLIDARFADFGDVDTALIGLRLANGALASFEFGRRTSFGCDEMIEAFGADGLLIADRQPVAGARRLSGSAWTAPGLDPSWRTRFAATYVAELDAFAAAIKGEAAPHATLRDGLRAQAASEATLAALASGQATPIAPVWRRG